MTKTQQKIHSFIKTHKKATGKQLTAYLKITRQALNKQISGLIEKHIIVKSGSRKAVVYYPATNKINELEFSKKYTLENMHEDLIFEELQLKLNLASVLKKNALDILRFAFTEMLNNAIDHSHSKTCSVRLQLTPYHCGFVVRDYGIGIFNSISRKFGLKDEFAALQDLLKGKTTTMKERHSGEGVFFTSQAGDLFTIRSHKILYTFNQKDKEPAVAQIKRLKGTEITFEIRKNTKRDLTRLFREYAPEEYDFRFEKTRVFVGLVRKNPVSRSEAKRLLFGLERFEEIILDFGGVQSLGQGFADEVFRIFQRLNPRINITYKNANPAIQAMIRHVVDN